MRSKGRKIEMLKNRTGGSGPSFEEVPLLSDHESELLAIILSKDSYDGDGETQEFGLRHVRPCYIISSHFKQVSIPISFI